MKILYVGRYELPDKDATANRVVADAKLLRELGHEVVLAGWSDTVRKSDGYKKAEYFSFESYEKHRESGVLDKFHTFSDAERELELLRRVPFDLVIAYNPKDIQILQSALNKMHCRCDRMVFQRKRKSVAPCGEGV